MIKIPGIETYFGGKNGSGVYQTIINQFPPHDTYVEAFLGGGAILRNKRPAPLYNIGCELNFDVWNLWQLAFLKKLHPFTIHHECGIEFLKDINNDFFKNECKRVLIYLDPPFLIETKKIKRPTYKYDFVTQDHVRLLEIAIKLPFMVAISHYPNKLYDHYLKNWRKLEYKAQTRRGQATEVLYMNYQKPEELHEYNFLGSDYRERERIRKKIDRHVEGLKRLPLYERQAIINAITNNL